MFESIINFFKKLGKKDEQPIKSKDAAKERLHLVLMQDRANVSADFLDLMKQEIIEVIKKYIDVDENAIDVRLTNKANSDGTTGAPALYANIPIVSIKEEVKSKMARQTNLNKNKQNTEEQTEEGKNEEKLVKEEKTENNKEQKNKSDEKVENKKEMPKVEKEQVTTMEKVETEKKAEEKVEEKTEEKSKNGEEKK